MFGRNVEPLEATGFEDHARPGTAAPLPGWRRGDREVREPLRLGGTAGGGVELGEPCFVGVNATLRDHIKVGDRCVLGAGTLLLADAAPDGVYIGTATERSRVPSSKLRRI